MRRVVVTGMGMLSPFGRGVEYNWNNIVAGKSAIRKIENIELYDEPEPKEQRRVDKFILFGLAAGVDAMEDSGWKPVDDEDSYRAGVMMGSGIGGLSTIYEMSTLINENKSVHRVSPFFIPSCLINMISGHLSIKFALKGPNHACVTACSTGTHAIGDASSMIARGDADLMLAGGAESAVNILGLSGFARMKAITADFNDEPEKASRPWDQARSGFVMGVGRVRTC